MDSALLRRVYWRFRARTLPVESVRAVFQAAITELLSTKHSLNEDWSRLKLHSKQVQADYCEFDSKLDVARAMCTAGDFSKSLDAFEETANLLEALKDAASAWHEVERASAGFEDLRRLLPAGLESEPPAFSVV